MLQIYEQIYELTNLEHEIELWYSLWKEKNLDNTQLKDLEMCEIIKETEMFFPCISKAIHSLNRVRLVQLKDHSVR